MESDALYAALVAFAAAALLTPVVARMARRIGAVDELKERGLASEATRARPLRAPVVVTSTVRPGGPIASLPPVSGIRMRSMRREIW